MPSQPLEGRLHWRNPLLPFVTIHQIDTSLRMLEQISRQFELHTRNCAERIVRLLEFQP